MKKLFLLFISVILLNSCSPNADELTYHHFEYVPVTSVEAPIEFVLGQVSEIKVKYELPNSCYGYYNFDYIYQNQTREVKTIAIVNDEMGCNQSTIEGEYIINIRAEQSEVYTFKFWQAEGEYLTVIIPVI